MDTKRVVGLSYGAEDAAPIVVLKGAGAEAQSVLAQAQRQGDIPIVQAPELAGRLYRTPIDAPIDRQLFPVVAALLAHVVQADKLLREKQA